MGSWQIHRIAMLRSFDGHNSHPIPNGHGYGLAHFALSFFSVRDAIADAPLSQRRAAPSKISSEHACRAKGVFLARCWTVHPRKQQ
jgi:hypothetical protein